MGLVKGETILVERHAPLGDPMEYFIKGYHLALRKEEAAHIQVSLHGETNG
jgi:Fe2+ transport system protein FeoA